MKVNFNGFYDGTFVNNLMDINNIISNLGNASTLIPIYVEVGINIK